MTGSPNRAIRTATAATMMLAAVSLVGCSQIPASDNASACIPTDRFPVERSGDGSGPVITDNGIATFTIDLYDDKGQLVAENQAVRTDPATGDPAPVPMAGLNPSLNEMLRCAQAGQTVSADIPNREFYAADAIASGQVSGDASQHLTVHVSKVYHSAASGRIAPQRNGIPAVVNAPAGGHGVTMPKEPAPIDRRVAETISGYGEPIQQDDQVVVQLTAYTWGTSEPLFDSWSNVSEAMVLPATPGQVYTLGDAMVGRRIGTQLVVVVPAATLQEEAGEGRQPLGYGDAVVFVVDLLGKV